MGFRGFWCEVEFESFCGFFECGFLCCDDQDAAAIFGGCFELEEGAVHWWFFAAGRVAGGFRQRVAHWCPASELSASFRLI